MGDFNTCLLKRDRRCTSFETLTKSINLTILPLSATHKPPHTTASLLDLMLVSCPSHVVKYGQHTAHAFSHHDMIYLSYNVRPPKHKSKQILQRNFSSMNIEELRNTANEWDWTGVVNATSVDEKVYTFNANLLQIYDLHAPMRAIKLKHLPAPWLTDEIKRLMSLKCKAKSKYKRRPTETNKEAFILARNRCNRACRNAQRRYIHDSVDNTTNKPNKIWKFLKSLGVGKL